MDLTAPSDYSGLDQRDALGRGAASLQGLVDEAQVEFACGVGVDDVELRAIAYSRQPEEIDDVRRESILKRTTKPEVSRWLRKCGIWESTRTIHIPANHELGMFQRLCTPLRREGNLLGFFWLDHSGEVPDAASLTVISAYAERIAAALAHERFLEQRKRASEADAVRHILRGEALPSAARSRLAGSEACVAVALSRRFRSDLARQATEAELRGGFADLQRRLAARPTIGLVENAEGVFVVGVGRGGEAQMKADFEQLLSWLSSDGVRIGISEPRGNPMDLSDAYREARWSAEAAAAGGASNCITWASLGAGRTLFRLLNGRSVEKLLPAGFARLREVEGSDLLLSTLETYLEVGCDSKATAAAFSIHRSTLYQRLRRIEEVSGFDLKEGDDRLDLHLGLRLLRLGSSRTAVAS